jgi:protein-tyrosine phosphatase
MRYGLTFFVCGVAFAAIAYALGGFAWLFAWLGADFLIHGLGYAGLGPRVLGKRQDGTIAPWAYVVLGPQMLFTWATWSVARLVSREDCSNEVAPGLWLGRRPLPGELPAGVDLIVDLTAEFPENASVRAGREYVCIPVLDTTAPGDDDMRELVDRLCAHPGKAYVHCAQGHGRSACVVAAVLIRRGIAADLAAAEARLKECRPGASLKWVQREAVARVVADVGPTDG